MKRSVLFLAAVSVLACTPAEPLSGGSNEAEPLWTIAFGSCAGQDRPQPFWGPILAHEPDLFLFIGDNIYGDTEDMGVMRAKYDELGEKPGFQQLRTTVPLLATWDDHDYGVNDGGASYPMRDGSKEAFMDFYGIDADAPMRQHGGVYHSYILGPVGKRVQVILLDTRYFRGDLKRKPAGDPRPGRYVPSDDTTQTMLGAEQWTWLEEQLRQPAEVRLIASSIQFIPEEHGWEKWANLPHERTRMLGLLRETEAEGVFFISGDRHLAEISRLAAEAGIGYPLYDVTSSGLNRGGGGSADEPNRHRVGDNFRANNYGLITINWAEVDPTINFQVFDDNGQQGLQESIVLSQLRSD